MPSIVNKSGVVQHLITKQFKIFTPALRIRLRDPFENWLFAKHQERYPNLESGLECRKLKTSLRLPIGPLNHEGVSYIACLSVDRQSQKRQTRSLSEKLKIVVNRIQSQIMRHKFQPGTQ